jgi:hypothetical protein
MVQLDAVPFARDQEAYTPNIHQRHFVQVEDEPGPVPPDFRPEFVEVLRLDATDEP